MNRPSDSFLRLGPALGLLLALCLATLPTCTNTATQLNQGLASISAELEQLLRGDRLPNEHLNAIRQVHVANSLTFDPTVRRPVEIVREAIRGLAASDYTNWRDTAFTLQLLSSLAREHPVALIRAEAVDAVASMGRWTFEREVDTGDWASQAELIAALRVIGDVAGSSESDPSRSFEVADAIRAIAAYDFENGSPLPDTVSSRVAGRDLVTRLRHTRAGLLPITGSVLDAYLVDPDVLSAADRCCVALSASIVRLTLGAAALLDRSEIVRESAVRLLGTVPYEGGRPVIERVLRDDTEPSVRRQAVFAIARHGQDIAGAALIAALRDDTATVRGAAARQLQALSGEQFGDDRRAWIQWWSERPSSEDGQPLPDSPESGR